MNQRMRLMAVLISPLVLTPFLRAQMWRQPPTHWATVTGRVMDSEGHPVQAARISILPLDAGVSGGMPRQPITDQDGKYRLV